MELPPAGGADVRPTPCRARWAGRSSPDRCGLPTARGWSRSSHQGVTRGAHPERVSGGETPLQTAWVASGVSSGGLIHVRSEEHTSEFQSLMRISYAVFCLKKKKKKYIIDLN